jgi:hypothetical protein
MSSTSLASLEISVTSAGGYDSTQNSPQATEARPASPQRTNASTNITTRSTRANSAGGLKTEDAGTNAMNPLSPHVLKPTDSFSKYQIAWIVLQTIGSAGICFAANLGLCILAMMGNKVSLFQFPIPMAGAYAIVIIIEVIVNWFISGSMLCMDVLNGRITPINPEAIRYWPQKGGYFELNGYLNISELIAPTYKKTTICERLKFHFTIMLPWVLYVFFLLYPLALLISYLAWGLDNYQGFNLQPEILCGFLGSMIAITTIPVWSIMALASVGDKYLKDCSQSYLPA